VGGIDRAPHECREHPPQRRIAPPVPPRRILHYLHIPTEVPAPAPARAPPGADDCRLNLAHRPANHRAKGDTADYMRPC